MKHVSICLDKKIDQHILNQYRSQNKKHVNKNIYNQVACFNNVIKKHQAYQNLLACLSWIR